MRGRGAVSDGSGQGSRIGRGRFGDAVRGRNGGNAIPTLGEIGLNQFAPYLLNRVASGWNGDLQEQLKSHDLNTVKMRTLAVLAITSGLTINELSIYTVTEQSTMSRTLDAMEEQGLIRRQTREGDLRVREVHPTEAGREAFQQFWPTMYDRFSKLFRGIDEEEYQAFIVTLHKLVRNQQDPDLA